MCLEPHSSMLAREMRRQRLERELQDQQRQPSAHQADRSPEVQLAAMIREDLGVEVTAFALRAFIESRWPRLSALAHRIHNPKENPHGA